MTPATTPSRLLCSALAAVVAVALAACAGGSGGASADASIAALDDGPGSLDLISPAIRGGDNGLEVIWLVAHDDDDAVARALAPYVDQPVPLTDEMRTRWADSGFRIVRLPIDDLATLERTLSLVGVVNRQWMGWALEWREAFRGRSIEDGAPVIVDGLRRSLPGGALRFLGALLDRAVNLRARRSGIEFVPQLFEGTATVTRGAELAAYASGKAPPGFDARAEGRLFEALEIEASLSPGYVYVITSEAPGVDWKALTRSSDQGPTDDEGFVVEPQARSAPSGFVAGPPALSPPTLGEAMLSVRALGPQDRPARALVVLAPRAPSAFDVFAP